MLLGKPPAIFTNLEKEESKMEIVAKILLVVCGLLLVAGIISGLLGDGERAGKFITSALIVDILLGLVVIIFRL